MTAAEALASAHLPWHHADPFDRVLVAQAREHGLTIATRDPLIPPYGVPVLEVVTYLQLHRRSPCHRTASTWPNLQ